jgi:hypothetical protein
MYKITVSYDNQPAHWSAEYSDALDAFTEYIKFIDWGFADMLATINLTMPDGKMYTKWFNRNGSQGGK